MMMMMMMMMLNTGTCFCSGYTLDPILIPGYLIISASEMTYIVSGGALNFTHSLIGYIILLFSVNTVNKIQ